MIPLAAFEAVIDASGVAPRIEVMLPIGVLTRQLKVRTRWPPLARPRLITGPRT